MEKEAGKQITIGIVAHVDAGKTTLSEALLYASGAIRVAGRVDHGDSHLDTDEMERKRGITVFSAQSRFGTGTTGVTLLDTPGHADFAAETERVLPVLDYAVLLVSAAEGVQSHTKTLWKLLERYEIPVFVFFNKMDIASASEEELIAEMAETFGDGFVSFSGERTEDQLEEIALTDEAVMERFLEDGDLPDADIAGLIQKRKLFPCFFGSVLRQDGVEAFLTGLDRWTAERDFVDDFAARVFKITTDEQGKRLTHLRVTGGTVAIRQEISGVLFAEESTEDEEAEETETKWAEKVSEIRRYDGERFEMLQRADAGEVVTVCGLSYTQPGMGLGAETEQVFPTLLPVLTYQMYFAGNIDPVSAFRKIRVLEDELPELSLRWDEQVRGIFVKLMGEVQTEILAAILHDRFGYVVEFGPGRIAYRETIAGVTEGIGHFEPLRHYAEVHLKLEPGERGSGLEFATECSEDLLAKNWQRLILTHLRERQHRGVLTGSPITDMKITVIAGKAHAKHTMGGDFRQATYRAVRQGLMKAESVLLEPYYRFTLEVPASRIGRAMTDIDAMCGKCEPPENDGETAVLTGVAPVSTMHGYAKEVVAYTAGEGRLSLAVAGYFACHNAGEVVAERGYDPEADLRNPTGSVFCTHGAGFVVPWDQVEQYMHIESALRDGTADAGDYQMPIAVPKKAASSRYHGTLEEDAELFAIFEREFGPVKRRRFEESREISAPKGPDLGGTSEKYRQKAAEKEAKKRAARKHYLLVDGYNVIHTWDDLKVLANEDLAAARGKLADALCNYQGFTGQETILVFDAYKVPGGVGSVMKYHNIYIIYTKEAETADAYIEKATHEMAKDNAVTVVTSDGMVQLIVLGAGAVRMSSRELLVEMERVREEGLEGFQ